MIALQSLGRVLGTSRIVVKSPGRVGTSRIAVVSLGRVLGPAGLNVKPLGRVWLPAG